MTSELQAACERVKNAMQSGCYIGPPGQRENDWQLLAEACVAKDLLRAEREADTTPLTCKLIALYGFRHTGCHDGYQLWTLNEGNIEVLTHRAAFFITVEGGFVTVGYPQTAGEFRNWMRLLGVELKEPG